MAANLTNHQRRLNCEMPLVLMTDDRKADWVEAARALPSGSMVVVRGKTGRQRAALAESLFGIAPLLIADDPGLAAKIGAAGLHLPQARMQDAMHWRVRFPNWIITASAHDLRAVWSAKELDALFLSPVFATASHAGAKPLTPARAGLIALAARVPVYALGGVTAKNAARLPPGFSGIAAISSLL